MEEEKKSGSKIWLYLIIIFMTLLFFFVSYVSGLSHYNFVSLENTTNIIRTVNDTNVSLTWVFN